jgi:hypothetical protein
VSVLTHRMHGNSRVMALQHDVMMAYRTTCDGKTRLHEPFNGMISTVSQVEKMPVVLTLKI